MRSPTTPTTNRDLAAVLAACEPQTARKHVAIPPLYAAFATASTLFAGCGAAGSTATLLGNVCLTAPQQCMAADAPTALACGLAGAGAVRATESWRRKSAVLAEVNASHDRSLLSQTILVGTLPLQLASSVFAGDDGVSERAVVQLDASSDTASARTGLLQLVGAAASCAWAQGVVQGALTSRLTSLAVLNAARLYPEDPSATWWWPAVAASSAVAPVVAAAIAAALAATLDGAIARRLQPTARAEARARADTVASAMQRSELLFALDGLPASVAAQRTAEFQRAAREWQAAQCEYAWRCDAAALARALAVAAVYTVSGGSIFAPVVASLGAVDASGLAPLQRRGNRQP